MSKEGYHFIATATGSGNPTSITFADIPSGYKALVLSSAVKNNNGGATLYQAFVQFGTSSSIDTGANYYWHRAGSTNNTTYSAYRNTGQNQTFLVDYLGYGYDTMASARSIIWGYDDTNQQTQISTWGGFSFNSTTVNSNKIWSGGWTNTGVMTHMRIDAHGSGITFDTAANFTLWGMK